MAAWTAIPPWTYGIAVSATSTAWKRDALIHRAEINHSYIEDTSSWHERTTPINQSFSIVKLAQQPLRFEAEPIAFDKHAFRGAEV